MIVTETPKSNIPERAVNPPEPRPMQAQPGDPIRLRPALAGAFGQRATEILDLKATARPYFAVQSVLKDALANASSRTEQSFLDVAVASSRKERISETLLTDLVDARRDQERAQAVEAAVGALNGQIGAANAARLAEMQDELVDAFQVVARGILANADASFGALQRAGATTAEAAIKAGLSAEWLARTELGPRWFALQQSRAWLFKVSENGFGGSGISSHIDPMKAADDKPWLQGGYEEFWQTQFDLPGRQFSITDTPTAILEWWCSRPEDNRPTALEWSVQA